MEKPNLKVFLDTSALIAGIASPRGAAREILRLAELGLIDAYLSQQVIVEADRNVAAKLPELVGVYRSYIKSLSPVLVADPDNAARKKYSSLVHPNDAPILAAAIASSVDYLVTWDRKHFISSKLGVPGKLHIVTPGEFLREFRRYIETK